MRYKPRKMMAAVVAAPGKVKMAEVLAPEPSGRQVRVRIEGCGICGSNLAAWEGRPWFQYPLAPGELGHEGWGTVEAVGSEAGLVEEGERVALLSYRAFAEYEVVDETRVVRLPAELEGELFPGEGLGCAVNVFERSGVRRGDKVGVAGFGFLGALLTQLCLRAGAEVMVFTRRRCGLEMARELGAIEAVEMEDQGNVLERVRAWTGGKGCDLVIEATGRQKPLDVAGEAAGERGRLVIAGYHQDGLRRVNMQLWNWRGLDVINAHERDPEVYLAGINKAARAVARRELRPERLYTHRFGLEGLGDAFEALRLRPDGFMKGLVVL